MPEPARQNCFAKFRIVCFITAQKLALNLYCDKWEPCGTVLMVKKRHGVTSLIMVSSTKFSIYARQFECVYVNLIFTVIFASSMSFCRMSPTSGPGWMMPFSCASCGPGSLTTTVPYSCCSITTRAVRLGQRCSRIWSHQQSNTSWIWAFLQYCHSRTRMADTSSACGRVILNFWPNRDFIVL